MARYLYLDLETTGYSPREIVQLSYILCDGPNIIDYGDRYFRIKGRMDAAAYEVHGLSERRLNGLSNITFEQYIQDFIPVLLSADFIVGHNISFDLGCLTEYNHPSLNGIIESKATICTMKDYLKKLGTEVMTDSGSALSWTTLHHTIAILINRYGYDSQEILNTYIKLFKKKPKAHDGLFDTYLTYRIHQCMRLDSVC